MEAWRGMGDSLGWRPPLLCAGQGRLTLRHIPDPIPHLVCGLPRIRLEANFGEFSFHALE